MLARPLSGVQAGQALSRRSRFGGLVVNERAHLETISQILGWEPASLSPVRGGYTPAARFVARRGEQRAFVKAATTPHTAMLLRREIAAYRTLEGAPRPRLLGFDAGRTLPILVIEDLSDATWPPPWTDSTVSAAIAAIDTLHAMQADLPPFEAIHGPGLRGWAAVRADPSAFLALGLAPGDWLERALPALIEAEGACDTAGSSPTHWDLRSDNMCLAEGAVKLIDWAESCLSNPRLDLGFWLPSLAYEGGPPPEAILPDAPDVAAWVSGYFAARAGLPGIDDAPLVRRVQREQLSTALPWVRRALRL